MMHNPYHLPDSHSRPGLPDRYGQQSNGQEQDKHLPHSSETKVMYLRTLMEN